MPNIGVDLKRLLFPREPLLPMKEDDGFVADVETLENDGFVADIDEDLKVKSEDDSFVVESSKEEMAMNDSEVRSDGFVADIDETVEVESPIGQYISKPNKTRREVPEDLFSALKQSWTTMRLLESGVKPEQFEPGSQAHRLATQTPYLKALASPIGKAARTSTAILPWMMGIPGIVASSPLAATYASLEGKDPRTAAFWDAAEKLFWIKGVPKVGKAVLKKFPVLGEAISAQKIADDTYYWLKGRGMKPPPKPDITVGSKYSTIDSLRVEAAREEMPQVKKAFNESFVPKPAAPPEIEIAGKYSSIENVRPVSQVPDEVIQKVLGPERGGSQKLVSYFDVEAPFRKLGAPETGLNIKTMVSKKAAGEEKALVTVGNLNKFKLTPDEYAQVTLLAERPVIPEGTSPKVKEATKYLRTVFDDYAKILKEKGVLQKPFPQSMINSIDDTIIGLRSERDAILKQGIDLKSAKARSQITKYNYAITRLNNLVEVADNKIKSEAARMESKMYSHLPGGKGYQGILEQAESRGVISKGQANARVVGIYERQKEGLLRAITKMEGKKEALLADKSLNGSTLRALDELDTAIIYQQSMKDAFGQVKYVHIPLRIWLESAQKVNPSGFGRSFAGFRNIRGRESLSIQSLIDKGVVDKSQVDARDIVAHYIRYVEGQLAEKTIVDSAIREGLAKPAGKAPANWIEIPARLIPGFKGKKVHPLFADYLESHIKSTNASGRGFHEKAFSLIKMGRFYNPVFLPMYDINQGIMLGSMQTTSTPKYMRDALSMFVKKPKSYWQAYENGLFSTPYENPFAKFTENLASLKSKNDNTLMVRTLSRLHRVKEHPIKEGLLGLPLDTLKSLYNVSWNTAWAGDKVIRLTSYNYLIDKGFNPKESAQIAALFHGDYASVPPQTRRMLNQVFFTPTFKIAMTKLYTKMAEGGLKTIAKDGMKELGGKGLGATASERIYGRGVLYMVGLNLAWDEMMKSQGFEVDQIGRKYVKTVDTDEGPKEIVITRSGPESMLQRYFYKFAPVFAKDEPERMSRLANAIKYDLHPVYQWGVNALTNTADDGIDVIYNPFDKSTDQFIDFSKYTLRKMVGVFEHFLKEDTEQDVKARKAFSKSTNWVFSNVMKPISFRYIRKTKDMRVRSMMDYYNIKFDEMFNRDKPKNMEELQQRTKRLMEMQERLIKEIKKINAGKK